LPRLFINEIEDGNARAGVDWDLQCGSDPDKWSYNKLGAAIDAGLTSTRALDAVVERVLTQKFAAGLFDGRATTSLDRLHILDSAPHRALALEAAEQSIVMLINKQQVCQWLDCCCACGYMCDS
jgi:beta-glucosidase